MSLRARIALLVGVTVLLASAIGGIGTTLSSRSIGTARVDRALVGDAESFGAQSPRLVSQLQFAFDARRATCDDTEDADTIQSTDENDAAQTTAPPTGPTRRAERLRLLPEFASNLQLIRPTGVVISTCQTLPVAAEESAIAASGDGSVFRTVSIDNERFRLMTRGFGDVGAVQFARSLDITDDTLRTLAVRSVIFGLLGALCAAAVGWLFAKRATDPVLRLSQAAEHVAQTQDLGERITVEGDDEIGALADSFNTMLSSLDTSREQQQRLVQDASHELRTPLTSMRTNVELLQRHVDIEPELRAQILADIGAELHELTELTTELVDSATEIPTTMELRDEVNLTDLVTTCVERAQRRHHRTVEVLVASSHPTIVRGDFALLTRAVTNLINNAVKFSASDTGIQVEIQAGTVTVRDRGPGIPAEDLPFVFDRFYRATASRSAPGSGLGLAIVKQIVTGHGGSVSAKNRLDGGAAIGFSLPVVASADRF